MKIVNRGFIAVRPKQAFVDWANRQDEEFQIDTDAEPTVYLIEDDFFEVDPIIEASYKKIFMCELEAVTDDEDEYPEISMNIFLTWFSLEVGSTVIDLQEDQLSAE